MAYECSICNVSYKSRAGLWRHNKQFHDDLAPIREGKMVCGLCEIAVLSQIEICKHVSDCHSIRADIQDIEFDSVTEYESWKKANEEKRNCVFTRRSAGKQCTPRYYYCHRSGQFKSKSIGIRAPRHNTTNRSGFQCSAFIKSKIDIDGRVQVSCCLTHYGHDHDLSRIPLPDAVREQVKTHILEQKNPDWILKKMRGDFQDVNKIDRSQLLKKSDIFNIQRQYGLRKAVKNDHDYTSVAMKNITRPAALEFGNEMLTNDGESEIVENENVENRDAMEALKMDLAVCVNWADTAAVPDLDTLAAIKKKVHEIMLLIKTSSNIVEPELSQEAGPSNEYYLGGNAVFNVYI